MHLFNPLGSGGIISCPRSFVVFTDNQYLSFLNSQDKLSHRHVKWVEYLQSYTFTIKHKKEQFNKVVDALSRRLLTAQEIQVRSLIDLLVIVVESLVILQMCVGENPWINIIHLRVFIFMFHCPKY